MKIYIITGEKSGDQHAAQIVRHLRIKDNNIIVRAWGGDIIYGFLGSFFKFI